MTGERSTRGHRGSQKRLSSFNVSKPLRMTSLDKLEVEPLEGVPDMREANTIGAILEWVKALDAQLREKGFIQ